MRCGLTELVWVRGGKSCVVSKGCDLTSVTTTAKGNEGGSNVFNKSND